MVKKKIAVITPDLGIYGGVTRCAISAIEALNERGIAPDVYSISGKPDGINKKLNIALSYNFKKLFAPKRFSLYGMILKDFQILFKDYDYIYDFTNTIPLNRANCFFYVHFPEYIVNERGKYKRGFWRFYYLPRKLLNPISKFLFKTSKIDMVCNSEFTAKRIYETINKKIPVIHPPCYLEDFKSRSKKKKRIVSIGGFTAEKNQELQVKIASHFPKVNFEIFGSSTRNPSYLKKIKFLSRKMKNVNLHPNAPFRELKNILETSLFFIHTSENEPFGISTVEAISAGCIPLTHNSGGQKYVVPFKELRFKTKKEAIEKLKNILKWNSRKLTAYRKKLQKHIQQYNAKVFKRKLIGYLEDIHGYKK